MLVERRKEGGKKESEKEREKERKKKKGRKRERKKNRKKKARLIHPTLKSPATEPRGGQVLVT